MKFLTLIAASLVAAPVLALPRPLDAAIEVRETDSILVERASCYATCGSVCYYQTTINSAVSQGYKDYQSGSDPGGYPHTYNNYEGFDFPVNGPYQEFPVLNTFKTYSGGSPGADRVIFNTQGQFAGTITHTGASGDDFVACTGDGGAS